MNTAIITSWLLTYLVHSTILLGSAWLVSRALADRRLALQEILLRAALVGGLITATLQVGFGVESIGGAMVIDDLAAADAVAVNDASTISGHSATPVIADAGSTAATVWPNVLLSFWIIGSLLALFVLGRSIIDLRRLLKTRRFRPTGRLLDRLATAMGLRRPVRLSTTAAIAVPFATGIKRPEICCPERIGELASEHQKSLFAHELAHLARRDPAWQLIYRLGEALFFLQPLNRFVRRRLEEIAEHLTDERAVACTGNRLGLARCLVVVAHWGIADSPGVPATAFAAGPRLDRRVKRLISGTIAQHRSTRWAAPLLITMLIGSVLLLPAVMPTAVHANLTPTGSDAVPVETSSPAKPATKAPATAAPVGLTPAADLPRPAAPQLPQSAPAPEAVPRAAAAPLSPAPPAPSTDPVPAAVPEPRSEPVPPEAPAPPVSPTAPEPPQGKEPTPVEPSQRERAREEARERQREEYRERSAAEARARAEARALAAEARELAREASERSRLTEAEREKLRSEARELMRQAESEAQERARHAREGLTPAEREKFRSEARELMRRAQLEAQERARIAREGSRLTEEEREELRRRAEALHTEARERAREFEREARERARALSEEARRLAEEAEAKRLEEERR
jgi:beta-lactamase regulating signal transducer with metallopeptidase domain